MKILFAAFFCAMSLCLFAQDLEKLGIEIGTEGRGLKTNDVAPNFILKDAEGQAFDLYAALEKGPVAVVFYRGAWCPVCTKYLSNYADSIHLLEAKNVQTVFISPNRLEKLSETQEKTEGKLRLLHDAQYKVMDAYGVSFSVNENYQNKLENFTGETLQDINQNKEAKLPVPATFLIDTNKKIKYVQFDYNYGKRAYVNDVLNAL